MNGFRHASRTRRGAAALLLAAALCAPGPTAVAADAVPTERDPIAAQRAVRLGEKLRCLVCQNQTIGDSNAELAVDLRRQVHEQIAAGRTDQEIIDYMVTRYGDFVLYQPPLKATTLLLWGGPALLLLAGALAMAGVVRSRRRAPEATPLTAEERERAARLLGEATAKKIP